MRPLSSTGQVFITWLSIFLKIAPQSLAVTSLQTFQKRLLCVCQTTWFKYFAYTMYLTPDIWLLQAHLLVLSQPSLCEYLVSVSPTVICQTAGQRARSVVWGLLWREGGREGGREEIEWHIVNIRSIIVNIKPASVRMNGSRSPICLYRNIRLTI